MAEPPLSSLDRFNSRMMADIFTEVNMLKPKFALLTAICIFGSSLFLTGCGVYSSGSCEGSEECACVAAEDIDENDGICNGQCDDLYKKAAELWLLCAAD